MTTIMEHMAVARLEIQGRLGDRLAMLDANGVPTDRPVTLPQPDAWMAYRRMLEDRGALVFAPTE
jgi:hypothetical protein